MRVVFLIFLLLSVTVSAEVAPVALRISTETAWTGQRVSFLVELRSPGSFAGSASFDLPEIPGTLVMKIGNPTVSSEEIEGQSWFVQSHEFALFSQQSGTLEVPAFPVRFSQRDGFTGPVSEVNAEAPGFKIEIQRPAGSAAIPFLVTTESLDVTERWDPAPGGGEFGAVFKRSIVQRATELPGMALAPATTSAPEGIRVYPGDVMTNDQLDRGDFLGERRETITYMMQRSGTLEIPELNYVWWNPKTETLESQNLPAASFEIAPPTVVNTDHVMPRSVMPILSALGLLIALLIWQKKRLALRAQQFWKALNPPARVAARKLLRACRRNDASAAASAWAEWQNLQAAPCQPKDEIRDAIIEMQGHLFGPMPSKPWQGSKLARTFKQADSSASRQGRKAMLPPLNP